MPKTNRKYAGRKPMTKFPRIADITQNFRYSHVCNCCVKLCGKSEEEAETARISVMVQKGMGGIDTFYMCATCYKHEVMSQGAPPLPVKGNYMSIVPRTQALLRVYARLQKP